MSSASNRIVIRVNLFILFRIMFSFCSPFCSFIDWISLVLLSPTWDCLISTNRLLFKQYEKEKNASTSWKFKIELRIQAGGRTKIEELWSLRAKSWLWHIVVDHFIFMAWTHNYSHSINENDPIKKRNPYHFMAILEFMLLTGFFGWL